jgi:hypothetical protein
LCPGGCFSFLLLLSTYRDLSHTQTRSLSNFHSTEILLNALCNCCIIHQCDVEISQQEPASPHITAQQSHQAASLQRAYAASHDIKLILVLTYQSQT